MTNEKQLRGWQAEALGAVFESIDDRPVVRAVMGAGKSVLIAELVSQIPDTLQVVITSPSVRLVYDLAETLAWWAGIDAGRWYGDEHDLQQVTVCCNDSLGTLADAIGDDPVELWIADEVHKSECDSVKDAVECLDPYRRIGFTATPWRADESERLTLFDTLAYDYSAAQAIADGVVVEPKVRHYQGSADNLNEACAEAIQYAVSEDLGPGLVNARNIEDAREFADFLYARGIEAAPIHSRLELGDQQTRVEALHSGQVDCLVHVDMLAEGVDLPWLRWLCCRRPVGSSVRFSQEVGRVLRAAPGKDHAVVFDPHNLFGTFALDGEAVLSGGGTEADDPVKLPALQLDFLCEEIREGTDPPETYHGVPVRLIDPTASYLVKLRLQMEFAGVLDPEIKSTHWRTEPPSSKQIDLVESLESVLGTDGLPDEHRKGLEVAVAAAPGLKKGAVSDLIGILFAVRDAGSWPLEGGN